MQFFLWIAQLVVRVVFRGIMVVLVVGVVFSKFPNGKKRGGDKQKKKWKNACVFRRCWSRFGSVSPAMACRVDRASPSCYAATATASSFNRSSSNYYNKSWSRGEYPSWHVAAGRHMHCCRCGQLLARGAWKRRFVFVFPSKRVDDAYFGLSCWRACGRRSVGHMFCCKQFSASVAGLSKVARSRKRRQLVAHAVLPSVGPRLGPRAFACRVLLQLVVSHALPQSLSANGRCVRGQSVVRAVKAVRLLCILLFHCFRCFKKGAAWQNGRLTRPCTRWFIIATWDSFQMEHW